jgi:predicted nucleotidyltransferase
MDNTRKAEEVIKTTARKYIPDAEVVLFGSRSRMTHDSESDYDILIITHKNLSPGQKLPYKTRIRKELLISNIRSDILIQSHKEIEKKKKLPGHIIKTILNDSIFL